MMERRFRRDPVLKERYHEFISEYITMNHMTLIPDDNNEVRHYLPHHEVTKEESTTTKLRAVFDGSDKTSSGLSLNDCLMVGPTIQPELFDIVLRFRQHQYVLTGDIAKMFRQILIRPDQQRLQNILWREHDDQPVKIYQLNTVTYGLASSPFLSVSETRSKIMEFTLQNSIEWKFIPPQSPHTGGLWEAAVKSAKTHLKAVIKDTILSFEELYTVIVQVEAVLNSRPLCPLSIDPSDLNVLTLGHFLVETALNSVLEESVLSVPVNRMNRFQLLSQMQQVFWKIWASEYVTQLQARQKRR